MLFFFLMCHALNFNSMSQKDTTLFYEPSFHVLAKTVTATDKKVI